MNLCTILSRFEEGQTGRITQHLLLEIRFKFGPASRDNMKMMSKPSILTLSRRVECGVRFLVSFWRLCIEEKEDRGETKREGESWQRYVKEEGERD